MAPPCFYGGPEGESAQGLDDFTVTSQLVEERCEDVRKQMESFEERKMFAE